MKKIITITLTVLSLILTSQTISAKCPELQSEAIVTNADISLHPISITGASLNCTTP